LRQLFSLTYGFEHSILDGIEDAMGQEHAYKFFRSAHKRLKRANLLRVRKNEIDQKLIAALATRLDELKEAHLLNEEEKLWERGKSLDPEDALIFYQNQYRRWWLPSLLRSILKPRWNGRDTKLLDELKEQIKELAQQAAELKSERYKKAIDDLYNEGIWVTEARVIKRARSSLDEFRELRATVKDLNFLYEYHHVESGRQIIREAVDALVRAGEPFTAQDIIKITKKKGIKAYDYYKFLRNDGVFKTEIESSYGDGVQDQPSSNILLRMGALPASLFLFPVLALELLIVKIHLAAIGSKESVWFAQERIGYKGKTFKMYKVRTFINGETTYLTRILRWTRLDEIPQLWNVLRGDIGFIGPRPLTQEDLDRFHLLKKHYMQRMEQGRPGLVDFFTARTLKFQGYTPQLVLDQIRIDKYVADRFSCLCYDCFQNEYIKQ